MWRIYLRLSWWSYNWNAINPAPSSSRNESCAKISFALLQPTRQDTKLCYANILDHLDFSDSRALVTILIISFKDNYLDTLPLRGQQFIAWYRNPHPVFNYPPFISRQRELPPIDFGITRFQVSVYLILTVKAFVSLC